MDNTTEDNYMKKIFHIVSNQKPKIILLCATPMMTKKESDDRLQELLKLFQPVK